MRKIALIVAAGLMVFSCSTTTAPAAKTEGEATEMILDPNRPALVQNGSFEEGDNGLMFWNEDGTGGSATFTGKDGGLEISISDPGTETWSIGLYQPRVNIREGYTYTVSFKAKAEDERNITSYFGLAAPPWTVYGGDTVKGFTLTNEFLEYTYTFTSSFTDIKAQMCFALGNVGGVNATTIFIDEVTISEVAPE